MKCRVSRDKRGMDKTMYPTYSLHLEQEDTGEKVCSGHYYIKGGYFDVFSNFGRKKVIIKTVPENL